MCYSKNLLPQIDISRLYPLIIQISAILISNFGVCGRWILDSPSVPYKYIYQYILHSARQKVNPFAETELGFFNVGIKYLCALNLRFSLLLHSNGQISWPRVNNKWMCPQGSPLNSVYLLVYRVVSSAPYSTLHRGCVEYCAPCGIKAGQKLKVGLGISKIECPFSLTGDH